MHSPRSTRYDAVIIGAGLVGLACAWSASRRGLSVLVLERAGAGGAGASGVAAGMLAPVTEADFGEEAALRLCLAARERWPAFAARLEEETGRSTGFRESGALVVAADRDDVEELRRLHDLHRSLGLDTEWLTPVPRPRGLEPSLSPRIAGRPAGRGRRPGGPAGHRARAGRGGERDRVRPRGPGDRARRGARDRREHLTRHDHLRSRGGGGRRVVGRARPGGGPAGPPREGTDPPAARPRRRRRAARPDRAHPALLPRRPR